MYGLAVKLFFPTSTPNRNIVEILKDPKDFDFSKKSKKTEVFKANQKEM